MVRARSGDTRASFQRRPDVIDIAAMGCEIKAIDCRAAEMRPSNGMKGEENVGIGQIR